MNNYKIIVKKYCSDAKATEGVNDFIRYCNNEGVEILDITSHYASYDTEIGATTNYVFIFKVKQ